MAAEGGALRVGTRGSPLALWQADWVERSLRRLRPGAVVERVIITTSGDRDHATALAAMGGRGVFVTEIETALRSGRIDVAVHSCKDVPTTMADDLMLAAYPVRARTNDVFVSSRYPTIDDCPPDARIGTGSPRRRVQLHWASPRILFVELRGNLDTRLRKVREGEVDGAVLAAAGIERLGKELVEGLHVQQLGFDVMIPAAGQGALALQTRVDDPSTREVVGLLDDPKVRSCVEAERAFLGAVGGGCHQPVGALARLSGRGLTLEVAAASTEDGFVVRSRGRQLPGETPQALGERVAQEVAAWLVVER